MSELQRVDKAKVRQSFAAAANSYDAAAALQRQVALRLIEQFPLQTQAGVVLDVGCGTGFLTQQLVINPSIQTLFAVDMAMPMLQTSQAKPIRHVAGFVCADAEQLPFVSASLQQIYSSLALQWCQNLATTLADFRRMLKQGGQLVFATFGEATLHELKTAWAAVDDFAHVNSFESAAQITTYLQRAGFSNITLTTVLYQPRYPSVMALMQELKAIGAHNVNLARSRKPTTRQQLQAMIEQYHGLIGRGELLASYEVLLVRAES